MENKNIKNFEKFAFQANFSTYMRLQSFRFKGDKPIKRQISKKINFSAKLIFLLLIFLFIILYLFWIRSPSLTGYSIFSKETAHNQSLNLNIKETSNYTLVLSKPGSLKSISATGSYVGNGTVRIYIEKDGKKYLMYENGK